MSRRAAIVTQADVARSIRAVLATGLRVIRVVARADGVSIETDDDAGREVLLPDEKKERVVL